MTDIPVKGYATYDKLKTCIVGRTYNKEQFKHIKNQKVKDILFRILETIFRVLLTNLNLMLFDYPVPVKVRVRPGDATTA